MPVNAPTPAIDHDDSSWIYRALRGPARPLRQPRGRSRLHPLLPADDLASQPRSRRDQCTTRIHDHYRVEVTAVMATSTPGWKAAQHLMRNHTIAERMFCHDPSVMLHAPLRTLLCADPAGAPIWPSINPACCSAATTPPRAAPSAANATPCSLSSSSCSERNRRRPSHADAHSRRQTPEAGRALSERSAEPGSRRPATRPRACVHCHRKDPA